MAARAAAKIAASSARTPRPRAIARRIAPPLSQQLPQSFRLVGFFPGEPVPAEVPVAGRLLVQRLQQPAGLVMMPPGVQSNSSGTAFSSRSSLTLPVPYVVDGELHRLA